jgi:uncharacterized membrane protein (UPF0127 family)
MAWLLRDGRVLATVEVAGTRKARRRGLRGRCEVEGALLLQPCRQVHTFGMRVPIDVAACARDGTVLWLMRLPPGRVSWPAWRAAFFLEARAGAFASWGIGIGDRLEIVRGGGQASAGAS